jgi:hypothetical protein
VVRDDLVLKDVYNPSFTLRENDTLLVLGDPEKLVKIEEEAKAI